MKVRVDDDFERNLYDRQNRVIHKARALLCMDLDGCRELAREIGGQASISSLTIKQRWELIEILKIKGARVRNPSLQGETVCRQDCEKPEDVYPNRLRAWKDRFPRRRPGFASNKELAWIEALWELDFSRGFGESGKVGLRRFIYRQTSKLKNGPISDLAFLRKNHVQAVLTPLKARARANEKSFGS